MLQNPKTKKILILSYVAFLILGTLYVRSIVNKQSVDVGQKNKEKENTEQKEVNVKLVVQNGSLEQEYNYTGKSVDSIMDMFENLRSKQDFKYQVIEYTYGIELDNINGQKAGANQKWHLLDGEKDITHGIPDINLEDGKKYVLKLDNL